jgi:hypothetical protein
MSARDSELIEMVGELSRMPIASRETILELIGDEASRKILPLLQERVATAHSPALSLLIEELTATGPVDGLTIWATAAILDAARKHGAGRALANPSAVRGAPAGMIDRFTWALFGKRAG